MSIPFSSTMTGLVQWDTTLSKGFVGDIFFYIPNEGAVDNCTFPT